MNKILVTYATMAGSTAEVAKVIGEELLQTGKQVDILPLKNVFDLSQYEAVILGAPMIMGWHRSAQRFLKANCRTLQRIPLAIFATSLSLTSAGEKEMDGVPIFADERLVKPPKDPHRPTRKELHSNIRHYAGPILKSAGPAPVVSLAFFGGALDYRRLKLPAMLFVGLIIQAQPGDRRNWPAIRTWARNLPALFIPRK